MDLEILSWSSSKTNSEIHIEKIHIQIITRENLWGYDFPGASSDIPNNVQTQYI